MTRPTGSEISINLNRPNVNLQTANQWKTKPNRLLKPPKHSRNSSNQGAGSRKCKRHGKQKRNCSRELASSKLEQSHKAYKLSRSESPKPGESCDGRTEEEESLASCQTDQNKWRLKPKLEINSSRSYDSVEKLVQRFSVDDDETFVQQHLRQMPPQKLWDELSLRRSRGQSQSTNQQTIEIADPKRQRLIP